MYQTNLQTVNRTDLRNPQFKRALNELSNSSLSKSKSRVEKILSIFFIYVFT